MEEMSFRVEGMDVIGQLKVAVKVSRPAVPSSWFRVEADTDFAVLLAALTAAHARNYASELRVPSEDAREHHGTDLPLVRAAATLHMNGVATEVVVEFLNR
jgi:hypothetical protein